MSAAKSATTVSGKVSVKVCINRAGLVTYVELNNTETTIRDKQTLSDYLKAARGYKFQPDLTAPKEQCGKLSFTLGSTVNNKINNIIDGDASAGNAGNSTGAYDGSGDGVFGRKIIYRDMSAAKSATTVSGKVSVKVCINRAGLVTYVELNNTETTIRDKQTLKNYLKAARGYKFQPDLTAPKEQCGKMSFNVDNTANNKLK